MNEIVNNFIIIMNPFFNIVSFIKDYEEMSFGEILTDLSEPERVLNMYVYMIGEEIVADYINKLEKWTWGKVA